MEWNDDVYLLRQENIEVRVSLSFNNLCIETLCFVEDEFGTGAGYMMLESDSAPIEGFYVSSGMLFQSEGSEA